MRNKWKTIIDVEIFLKNSQNIHNSKNGARHANVLTHRIPKKKRKQKKFELIFFNLIIILLTL